MGLGAFIRRSFGPYERAISEAYRSIYIDIDQFANRVRLWQPGARRILEVGCGEGAVTERLVSAYPAASVTAIDVTTRVGRLYRGPAGPARFLNCAAEEIAAAEPGQFDLIVLCDVMHHVPVAARQGLLESIRVALAPQGGFVFKDWERSLAPIHWLCYASDRWITGDRIHYMTGAEMRERLVKCFGAAALVAETRIAPWWNNYAVLIRPGNRPS